MGKIAVVTDSTATIHQETIREYGIHVAPLHINWDKVKYRDGIDITPKEFYERLRTSVTLPTTSGAIVAEFLKIFEALPGKTDGVVAIVLSKELSAVYNSLMTAKEMVSDIAIEVIDSKLATMAMGFAVVAAAKVAAGGGHMTKVVTAANEVMAKVHLFFALDNLDYLRRGGRVNMPAAVIANLLQVKPVLTLKDGKVEPVAKPRTKPKAIETLLNLMKERVKSTPLHVDVMHADDHDAAENLKREISLRFQCAELLITDFTPVMGSHTGPNALIEWAK
jgi:DegV family protein with EDD domain